MTNPSDGTNALRFKSATPYLEYELLVDAPEVPATRSVSASPRHAIAGDVLLLQDDDLTPVQLRRGGRRIGDPEWWQVRHLFDGLADPWAPCTAPETKAEGAPASQPAALQGSDAPDHVAQLSRYEGADLETARLMLELLRASQAAGVAIGWRYPWRRGEPIGVSVAMRADSDVRFVPEDPGNVVDVYNASDFRAVPPDPAHPQAYAILVRPRSVPSDSWRSLWIEITARAVPFTESDVALGSVLAATAVDHHPFDDEIRALVARRFPDCQDHHEPSSSSSCGLCGCRPFFLTVEAFARVLVDTGVSGGAIEWQEQTESAWGAGVSVLTLGPPPSAEGRPVAYDLGIRCLSGPGGRWIAALNDVPTGEPSGYDLGFIWGHFAFGQVWG
jgi:hypothetical protein